MIKKLIITFPAPLSLPTAPRPIRLRLSVIHYLLAGGFVLGPSGPILFGGLAMLLAFFEQRRRNAYTLDAISFAWQRIMLSFSLTMLYMGLLFHGTVGEQDWMWLEITMTPLLLVDGLMLSRGRLGFGYLPRPGVLRP